MFREQVPVQDPEIDAKVCTETSRRQADIVAVQYGNVASTRRDPDIAVLDQRAANTPATRWPIEYSVPLHRPGFGRLWTGSSRLTATNIRNADRWNGIGRLRHPLSAVS